MKVLAFLAAHPNEVIGKDRLIAAVWGHTFVSDAALTRCIFEIRQAFGDDAKSPRFIETVPKVGYRLIARLGVAGKNTRRGFPIALWSSAAALALVVFFVSLPSTDSARARHAGANHPLSHDAFANDTYRKGVEHYNRYTYFNNENAMSLFQKAVGYDPSFGLAHARLADTLTQQVRVWGGDRLADARAAAETALELAPLQPQTHNAYGVVLELSGEGTAALDAFRRAYTLDPTHWQSTFNAAALHKIRLEFMDGNMVEAQNWFDHVTTNHSSSGYAQLGKAQIQIADGNTEQGTVTINQVLEESLRKVPERTDPWDEYWIIAACYALLGDKTSAFDWLEKAAASGRRFYLWDSSDPVFANLRSDQRFSDYIATTKSVNP